MYIKRHLEKSVLKASEQYPIVMVCGQRQVGKSTMLYHIKEKNRNYVTLDDANARRLAESDPALFFENYGFPLIIDEFQRAPSLLLELKKIVDKKMLSGENCNGLYWLTGSQKFHMMKDIADSLAGRIAIFELSSFSAAEIDGFTAEIFSPEIDAVKTRARQRKKQNIHQIYERIFRGGMPKLITTEIDRERFYSDYVNTYLERDIRDLAQVGKIGQFYDFLVFMAGRTGQELKYADIAKMLGISQPTAKNWVSILEQSGVIYLLRPYFANLTKRLVKTPKIYFMDTGLAAYLCRWTSPETLEYGAMDGAFFETYVVTEIIKSFRHNGNRENLYYYRDVNKREIDLLMIENQKIFPIEIKKSSAPSNPDKNFYVLDKFNLEVQPGLIICACEEVTPYNRNAWYSPIFAL
ncbi:MAG: ATP-binding protein [Selenomonadaceae bacterium]|nr:ATP-binding protein [Selenomonadaceae bacterium]